MSSVGDRYRIVSLLGSGSMAEVFEVVDESRGVTLALKRLLPDRAGNRAATLLLRREYETLTELSHPLIIRAFDYGQDGRLPCYTMERLSGQSLAELSPLAPAESIRLVRDVASALALVHSRKLVHRDVSSRNVCRTEDGRAKLLDFGALAPMGPPREIIGTPPFMPPESLEQRPLDARADLFSLGALAYYSLTGRHAYPARKVAELGDVWRRPVPPPSSFVPDVPSALDELVLALIHLNPLVRPASAAEVYDRLTALGGLPATEVPETARAYFLTPSLVARKDELTRFRRRLLRAERGRGGTLLVESAAGGGRSRLLSNFLLEARLRGVVVVSADGNRGQSGPFGVARALAASLRESEPTIAQEIASADPELAHVLGLSGEDESSVRPEDWVSATERTARALLEVARKRTLVVGVDDVAGVDGPSASVLAALGAAAIHEPVLLLGTAVAGSDGPAVERMRRAGGGLRLRPLKEAETQALVSSVFGDVPHGVEVSAWAHRISRGVPRTTLELLQRLVDSGLARYEGGGWVLPASLDGLELPASVDAALDARVRGLEDGARRIAEALCLTNEHEPLLVTEYPALLDEASQREIFSRLNALVSGSILVDAGSTYVFANPEIRSAVLRGVSEARRKELHGRLAAAYRSGPAPLDEVAAHHLLQAGDPAAAFRLLATGARGRRGLFGRGMGFLRTPEAADTVDRLYEWGREHGAAARDLAPVSLAVVQLASMGNGPMFRHAPEILATLRRDAGLVAWERLDSISDPVERIQRAVMETYADFSACESSGQRLPPNVAIEHLALAAASLAGMYARRADNIGGTELDRLFRPLRVLSPTLEIVGQLVELAGRALRGTSTRELRVQVTEMTAGPVEGLEETSRVAIHILSSYYLALEDMTQGIAVPDERLAPLDGSPQFAPLAWQARMLREYYRGDERRAEQCRRRRDVALTGRMDVDGHLETSILYEATAYATLGNLMALKRLLPVLAERAEERPGWRPHYRLAAGSCHFLRRDYEAAVAEYELGLALPDIDTHAGQVLLLARLVRSLVALGRFDEARTRAQEALLRHAREPLIPQYLDDLDIALARAEAGAGDAAAAVRRVAECERRIAERGVSGVLLVNFLFECAMLAHDLGDHGRFDELTRRVGALVAGADSTALATRYASLLSLKRSATFEPLAASPGVMAPTTVYTALAADVRTELERCRGPSERARRALELVMRHSGAGHGFLYLQRTEQLEFAAAVPEGEPSETLDQRITEWVTNAFDSEDMTTTASLDEAEEALSGGRGSGPSGKFVEIVTNADGEAVLVGVAVLDPSGPSLARIPSDVLRAVGDELVRSGDVSGRPLFTKSVR
ncbi:MAG TPA: protein kinase [Polyangiaceae bacterium]|nr:protein kinase [Polyangiaceae bacterium]